MPTVFWFTIVDVLDMDIMIFVLNANSIIILTIVLITCMKLLRRITHVERLGPNTFEHYIFRYNQCDMVHTVDDLCLWFTKEPPKSFLVWEALHRKTQHCCSTCQGHKGKANHQISYFDLPLCPMHMHYLVLMSVQDLSWFKCKGSIGSWATVNHKINKVFSV